VRWPVSAERVEGRLTSNARCLRAAVSSMVCLVGFWVQSWISGSNLVSSLDFEFNIVIFPVVVVFNVFQCFHCYYCFFLLLLLSVLLKFIFIPIRLFYNFIIL